MTITRFQHGAMLSINDTRHQCSICPRSYKRPEHLRRHQDAHDAGRIYTCQSCSTSFHRSDVLKRHSQTCRDRKAQASHRRRACERCVRQKKACDTGAPCSTCTSRHEICSNRAPEQTLCGSFSQTHAEHVPGHSSPEIPHSLSEFTDVGEEGLHFPTSPFEFALIPGMLDCTVPIDIFSMDRFDDRRGSERPSSLITRPQTLDFLARFTSKTGLISSFDCGTLKQRQDVLSVITDGDKEPVLGVTDLLEPSTSAASPTPAIADSLLWRTHEILLLAKEVTTIKPRNSIVDLAWSAVVEKMCSQFFSPCNLRKYLEFFWSIWHPNVNFIHRPTFSPAECKVTLLASMVLLGACVSPEQADQQNASMWFNVVEEMVFSDPDLSRDLSFIDHTPFDHIRDHKNIQALQAAYNVCLCQNWEGTDASRQRIRRYRFSTMVSAARDIGIYNAQHRGRLMQGYIFRWERFVAEEELIRVFLWIFLLDTAFVIFNNLPPRMLIKEAKIHMACPESCFQADTAGECQQQLQLLHHTGGLAPELLLKTAVEDLCNANLAQARMDAFANLGPLNLFVLASAMHYLIFQYQNSFTSDLALEPLRNALCSWEEIWQIYMENYSYSPPHVMITDQEMTSAVMWRRVGFMKHADEYWLLAKLMTERILSSKLNLSPSKDTHYSVGSVHSDTVQDDVLIDYDQTSMQQVNDLISALQSVQI